MAGHMGSKFRTLLNLEIIKSDIENGLIYIKGSIPGSKNYYSFFKKIKKIVNRKTSKDKFSSSQKPQKQLVKRFIKERIPKKEENKQVKKEEPKKK